MYIDYIHGQTPESSFGYPPTACVTTIKSSASQHVMVPLDIPQEQQKKQCQNVSSTWPLVRWDGMDGHR